MKILNASDAEFRRYGRIVTGLPLDGLLAALKKTPLPDGTDYVPRDDILHAAADVLVLFEIHVGMYVQQPVRQPVPKRFLVKPTVEFRHLKQCHLQHLLCPNCIILAGFCQESG